MINTFICVSIIILKKINFAIIYLKKIITWVCKNMYFVFTYRSHAQYRYYITSELTRSPISPQYPQLPHSCYHTHSLLPCSVQLLHNFTANILFNHNHSDLPRSLMSQTHIPSYHAQDYNIVLPVSTASL